MTSFIKKIIDNVPNNKILDFVVENKLPYDSDFFSDNKFNYTKLIKALRKNSNKQCLNKIKTTFELLKLMNQDNKLIVNKGFILSNLIYEDPTYRIFSDVDLYSFDFDKSYRQAIKFNLLDDVFLKMNNIKELLLTYKGVEFEIKPLDEIHDIKKCYINDMCFFTFGLEDSFKLLINNTYKNFFSDYGFRNDCYLRDLFDLFCFIKKYGNILGKKTLDNDTTLKLQKLIALMKTLNCNTSTIDFNYILSNNTENFKLPFGVLPNQLFDKDKRNSQYLKYNHNISNLKNNYINFNDPDKTKLINGCLYRRLWMFDDIASLDYGIIFYRFELEHNIGNLIILIPKPYVAINLNLVIYNKYNIYGDKFVEQNITDKGIIGNGEYYYTVKIPFMFNEDNILENKYLLLFFNCTARFGSKDMLLGAVGFYDKYLKIDFLEKSFESDV